MIHDFNIYISHKRNSPCEKKPQDVGREGSMGPTIERMSKRKQQSEIDKLE